jgi:ribosomal protein S15P/S13E
MDIKSICNNKYLIVSIVGTHAGEGIEKIIKRKQEEIKIAGKSFWLIISNEAKVEQIQKMCKEAFNEGITPYCIFISPKQINGAKATKISDLALSYSIDGKTYLKIPKGIKVTGKIQKNTTGMVFEDIVAISDKIINLNNFLNYNSKDKKVKLGLGRSTMCVLKTNDFLENKDNREIIAVAKLKEPYAVKLRK